LSVFIPWTRINDLTIRPRLFSGNQEGVLGGADLQIPRMGDRFVVDVSTSQLRQDPESRHLIALLMEATTADARIELRLPNRPQPIGSGIAVDGAGQTGSTLNLRGLFRQTEIVHGRFFSVVHGGVHFVYMTRGRVVAGADGKAAVPIWPMLRFITVDGEEAAFDQPMIEGQLVGFDKGAGFERNRTKPLGFSIQERK
jgi:hypothetical protein